MCGAAAWYAAAWARAYCDAAFEAGQRFGLLRVWLPLLTVGGGAYAVLGLGIGRLLTRDSATAVRAVLSVCLVVATVLTLVWVVVATIGTPAGRVGPPGVCPAGNVPPPWPDWLPL